MKSSQESNAQEFNSSQAGTKRVLDTSSTHQTKSDGDDIEQAREGQGATRMEQAQEGQGATRMEKKIKLMEKRLQPQDEMHEDDGDVDGGGDATTREEEVDPPKTIIFDDDSQFIVINGKQCGLNITDHCNEIHHKIEASGGTIRSKKIEDMRAFRETADERNLLLSDADLFVVVLPGVTTADAMFFLTGNKEERVPPDVATIYTEEWLLCSIAAGEILEITDENRERFVWTGAAPASPSKGTVGVVPSAQAGSKGKLGTAPVEARSGGLNRKITNAYLCVKAKGQGFEASSSKPLRQPLCATAAGQGPEAEKSKDGVRPPESPSKRKRGKGKRLNEKLVKVCEEVATYYGTMKGDSHVSHQWKERAWKKYAGGIKMRLNHVAITETNYKSLLETKQQGKDGLPTKDFIDKHIKPWIETGSCPELKQARDCEDYSARKELLSVHGVGGEMLKRLLAAGARSVKDLDVAIKAAEDQGEVDSNGFVNFNGVNLIKEVIVGVKHHEDMKVKIPRDEVGKIGRWVEEIAKELFGDDVGVEVTGSYRRGKGESGDVDMLVLAKEDRLRPDVVVNQLVDAIKERTEVSDLKKPTDHDKKKRSSETGRLHDTAIYLGLLRPPKDIVNHSLMRRFDLRCYKPEKYPYALLHMTGSGHFNRSMRHLCKRKWFWRLSDVGLTQREPEGGRVCVDPLPDNIEEVRTEEDIFKMLDLEYVPPHERHDNSVKAAVPTGGEGGDAQDDDDEGAGSGTDYSDSGDDSDDQGE